MGIFGRRRRLAAVVAAGVLIGVQCVAAGVAGATEKTGKSPSFTQLAELVNPDSGESITTTAASGDMVFAGAPNSTLDLDQQGAIFAYRRPTSGWSGQPRAVATLVASSPQEADGLGGVVAAAGSTVVAGASQPMGSGRVEVFSEPAQGWSGTVVPSATLTPPAGLELFDPQISGNTIVALGAAPTELNDTTEAEIYVFPEPAGGWSGTLAPSAELQVPNAYGLAVTSELAGVAVSFDGREIAAGSAFSATAYVFSEPNSGWSGSQTPSASLTVGTPGPNSSRGFPGYGEFVTFAGSSVVADQPASGEKGTVNSPDVTVFSQPAGGWADEGPTAVLSDGQNTPSGPAPMLFSGSTLLVPVGAGASVNVPQTTGYAVFDQPSAGFSGAMTASATLAADTSAATGASFDGSDVIVGAVDPEQSTGESSYASADGATVTEGTNGEAEVFANVARASGLQQPIALLHPPVGTSAAVAVYQESTGGWRSASPSALLRAPGYANASALAQISAQRAVIAVDWNDGIGGGAAPPGGGDLYLQPFTVRGAVEGPDKALRDITGSPVSDVTFSGRLAVGLVGDEAVVLAEPDGGWGGQVRTMATYALPRRRFVQGFALTNTALFIGLSRTSNGRATWEVIPRPTRGWSGRLSTAATLAQTPAGEDDEVAVSGGDVVVGGLAGGSLIAADATSSVDLYARPRHGWHGRIPPSVTLSAPSDGVWLWRRPVSGWRRHQTPSARIASSPALSTRVSSISGNGAAITIQREVFDASASSGSLYPDQIWVLDEPPGGWRGTLSGTAQNETPLTEGLGSGQLDGDELIVAGQNPQGATAVFVDAINGRFPAEITSHRA